MDFDVTTLSPKEVEQLVEQLSVQGYSLSKQTLVEDKTFVLQTRNFDGNSFKVGIVSDTHLCSRYQQLSHLHSFYRYCTEHEGIDTILHAGDLSAGNGHMYRGQRYEIFIQGGDAQCEYIRNEYPQIDNVTTYVIAGNHDLSHMNDAGFNLVKGVCESREDLRYLGMYGATVELHGIKFYLHHGEGGVSYARSYKLQKTIEQLAPQIKPNILIEGHFHITCTLKMYRNVYAMMAGCFEAQTPYLLRKTLYPEIGGTILEVTYDDAGLVKVHEEWIPNYVPVEDDYPMFYKAA